MKLHVQKCQYCQKNSLKNILVREPGEPDKVFVQCQSCQKFVASYVIAPLGYYHHGKGFESFLRSFNRSGEFMSGRRIKNMFQRKMDNEVETFGLIIDRLKEKEKSQTKNEG